MASLFIAQEYLDESIDAVNSRLEEIGCGYRLHLVDSLSGIEGEFALREQRPACKPVTIFSGTREQVFDMLTGIFIGIRYVLYK